jgi:uncharacterized protein YbaA (DUF1428 family)
MIGYVDGFVLPVPKRKLAAYRRLAKLAARVWKDHGALEYRECVGEDLKPGYGLPFPRLSRARRGEVVFFSWIGYRDRAHRDRVNKAVMADPRLSDACDAKDMPFDLKRMACGGFELLVGF